MEKFKTQIDSVRHSIVGIFIFVVAVVISLNVSRWLSK